MRIKAIIPKGTLTARELAEALYLAFMDGREYGMESYELAYRRTRSFDSLEPWEQESWLNQACRLLRKGGTEDD